MEKEDITPEWVHISEIIPFTNNPRKNDKAVDIVSKSIKEFGFTIPIILDKNNVIIAGHTRLKAAMKLGMSEVPVIWRNDLTDKQVKAFRILDNKSSEYAEWDLDKLKEELIDLKDLNYNLDLTGFSEVELNKILPDEIKEEYEEPAEPKYKINKGEIYQLGNHRLMCGDCTIKENVDKLMDGQKADMVFTDPPYGMDLDTDWSDAKSKLKFALNTGVKGFSGNKYNKVIGDNIDFSPLFIFDFFDCKEIFLWGADYYKEFIPKTGSWFVWDKRSNDGTELNFVSQSDKMYGSCFELCWSKEKHKREIARFKWAGIFGTEREPDKDKGRVHPTQKPVDLAKWFIEKFSDKDNLIIDLFGGSGSTLIACEQTNRKCFMMELDTKYCSVIIERFIKLKGIDNVYKINEDGTKTPIKDIEINRK